MVEPSSHTGQPPIKWVHDPTLPLPWMGLIDQSTGLVYFWNPITNVTQYERPYAPQYHHQFYLEKNPYPWRPPLYDWPKNPKPLSTSHVPSAPPHRVTIPINYPRHRSFICEEGQDRISELPDELISHILCFLSTVSAVRTTLLSKRWNKLWTSVRHLDFDIVREMIRYRSRFESFVQFVFIRLSSPDIGKFRLRYVTSPDSNSDSSLLSDWVSAAIWLNVVELDLKILNGSFEYLCDLPQSIFWCKTLKVLKLWIDSDIAIPEPPTSGCFPSLKIFHLTVINPGERLGILLSYFPVLEDLSIHGHVTYSYSAYSNMNVKVSTPELKTLKLSMERAKRDFMYDDDYYETPKQNSFCVDAPKLENLEVIQIPLSNVILENPKSVVHASIAFKSLAEEEWPSFPDRAYQLLTGISNVKCLSLSDQPFEASNLPVFGNLNQLRLVLRNRNSWEFLTLLLPKTPNLEDLDLVLEDGTEGQKDDPELEWTPPELVPDCLSSNLKAISIRGFKGLQVETKLAKYMLLNGCLLNKMTIYTCMLDIEESCKDLLTFPTCQVEFKEIDLKRMAFRRFC